jgi:flavodoxin
MKIGVFYYSFSGNTKKVAELLVEALNARGHEVYSNKIEPRYEPVSFFKQCIWAFFKFKAHIVNFHQPQGLDAIILGTPVWAFNPVPCVAQFVKQLDEGLCKKALVFETYGSGVGKDNACEALKALLRKKSCAETETLLIQEKLVHHPEALASRIAAALDSFLKQ